MTPDPKPLPDPTISAKAALEYASLGYWITPLKHASKQAVLSNWQNIFVTPERISSLFGDARNLGLLLGKPTDHLFIYCIDVDVDDPAVLYAVEQAIGYGAPQKRGKKGLSFFVVSLDNSFSNTKIKYKGTRGNPSKPIIEILGDGNQTVIPPSIHPETGEPYVWTNFSLLSQRLSDLPRLTPEVYEELTLIGRQPDSPILALNTMVWAGVGEGGDTHDTCVAAVASMVAHGWTDDAIFTRVSRAKRSSCERAGHDYDWPEEFTTIQSWIDSSRAKGHHDGERKPGASSKGVPKVRAMGDWTISHLGGMANVWKYEGSVRQYSEGYWPAVDGDHMLAGISTEFLDSTGRDVHHALMTAYIGIYPGKKSNLRAVCLQNGTYEVMTGAFREWRKDDRLMHRLPFAHDPSATCPNYENTVYRLFEQHRDETFEEDHRTPEQLKEATLKVVAMVEEFFALTLVDDMTFQKALIIRGSPGGGKSVLASVLQYLHGEGCSDAHNVSSIPLSDLGDERSRTALVGKLLNIGSELDATKPIHVPYFKAITGGDAVPVRGLYENTKPNVHLPTRFAVFCNEIPPYNDSSGAVERRLLVAPADNPLAAGSQQINFFEECLVPEMPGIFNRLMAALRRLYERGRFDIPESSAKVVSALRYENDSVANWILDRLETDPNGKLTSTRVTSTAELYADYLEWCQATNRKFGLAQNNWGRHLTHAGLTPVITKIGGKSVRCRRAMLVNAGEY